MFMIPLSSQTTTLGDVLNALNAAGIAFEPDSVDETGFELVMEGRPVRLAVQPLPDRLSLDGLDRFAAAAAEYDGRIRS